MFVLYTTKCSQTLGDTIVQKGGNKYRIQRKKGPPHTHTAGVKTAPPQVCRGTGPEPRGARRTFLVNAGSWGSGNRSLGQGEGDDNSDPSPTSPGL